MLNAVVKCERSNTVSRCVSPSGTLGRAASQRARSILFEEALQYTTLRIRPELLTDLGAQRERSRAVEDGSAPARSHARPIPNGQPSLRPVALCTPQQALNTRVPACRRTAAPGARGGYGAVAAATPTASVPVNATPSTYRDSMPYGDDNA